MTAAATRRGFVAGGLTGVLGVTLGGLTGCARAIGATGLPVRRDIGTMAADDPAILTFREGVRLMRERSARNPLDPLGWHLYGGIHSIFCATQSFRMQVHYGWYFLPWHRAYLHNLERKIRVLTGVREFALPYWDWTRSARMPAAMFGEGNPLNNTTRIYGPRDEVPADFRELGPAMQGPSFRHFAGYVRNTADPQVEGTLEQGAHNNVHNWIGGEMASFDGAGFDPIFALHHGNIDRLWAGWRAADPGHRDPVEPEWADHEFAMYGENGDVERPRVGDVARLHETAYTFDRLDWNRTLTPETTPVYGGAGQSLGSVGLTGADRAKVRLAVASASSRRVLVQYDRVQIPRHPFCHRFFLLHPGAGGRAAEAAYCGTFTLLPISDQRQGLDATVSTQLQVLTTVMPALLAGAPVEAVAVPVPLKDRPIPLDPLRLKGVRLVLDA